MIIILVKYMTYLSHDDEPNIELAADRAIENDPEARYLIPCVPPGKNDAI